MKFIHHPHRQSLYHHAFHVYRDWVVFLVVVISLGLGSILFHLYLFTQSDHDIVSDIVEPAPQATVNREAMKNTIDTYVERRNAFEVKKTEMPSIVDPAL